MSKTLGSFGKQRDVLDVDFDYFGTQIRVHPDLSDLVLVDFMSDAASLDENATDRMVADASTNMLRALVHPEDFDAFWKIAKAKRQNLEDLVDLCQQLLEAVTEVPTVQPSDSSDGLTPTGSNSVVVSSSPVVTRLEQQGRPDLALVVVRSQEFLSA